MKLVEFNVGSRYYRESCFHRDRILRQPLGLSLWSEDLKLERSHLHFGVVNTVRLIAGLMIIPQSNQVAKLRQMWVMEHQRSRGVGRFLISEVEQRLIQQGIQTLHLAARVSAIGFYTKLGFNLIGDEFEEVSLPHQRMEKRLNLKHGSQIDIDYHQAPARRFFH